MGTGTTRLDLGPTSPSVVVAPGSAVEAVADIVDVSQVDRVIAINVNRHPVLYEVIRTRLAARSSLHVDVNDDGRVDAAERRSANVIGRGLDDLD